MSDRGLQKHLALLIDEGFVEVTLRPGKPSTYAIKYDASGPPMGGEPQVHHSGPGGEPQVHLSGEAQVHPSGEPQVHPNYLTELDQRTNHRPRRNGHVPYAFEGAVIRVTVEQLQTWQKSFHAIPDIRAALQKLDDWYAEHGGEGWFHRVSRNLERDHQRNLADGTGPKKRNGGQLLDKLAAIDSHSAPPAKVKGKTR